MARCVVCGGKINEGGKDDIGICFMCETEKVKGEVVIIEVGMFKRMTGRTMVLTNKTIKRLIPTHTDDVRMYLMPKKEFKANIVGLSESKKKYVEARG